ncbi:hypothetical protein GPALN_014686 [Globodera pallida]|nr:hypothetical protein GPALN_014686 [Globodera pallida]
MVKDRLIEFQRLSGMNRNIANKFSSSLVGNRRSAESSERFANESTAFLPLKTCDDMEGFLSEVEQIRRNLDELDGCLRKMGEMHSKILTSPGVHPKITEELNANVQRFLCLSRSISDTLKRMKGNNAKSKTSGASFRIRNNHEMTLRRALQNLVGQFHAEQTQYKERCRAKINSYLKISGLQMPEDEVDQAIENGKLFNTVGIMMAERDKKLLFEDVKSRHDDIVQLEKTIGELHEMFQDLAMIVESQGEMVDHIERNVETAHEHADCALKTVKAAEVAKKRNMKLKIMLAICVVIGIIILFFMGTTVFCVYFPFICH